MFFLIGYVYYNLIKHTTFEITDFDKIKKFKRYGPLKYKSGSLSAQNYLKTVTLRKNFVCIKGKVLKVYKSIFFTTINK